MYVLLGKVGLTKIGNSPFDLSVTRVENPKISQHLHIQEKQQNTVEYQPSTTLFDFDNSISANCIEEGTLHEEQTVEKKKGFH